MVEYFTTSSLRVLVEQPKHSHVASWNMSKAAPRQQLANWKQIDNTGNILQSHTFVLSQRGDIQCW